MGGWGEQRNGDSILERFIDHKTTEEKKISGVNQLRPISHKHII